MKTIFIDSEYRCHTANPDGAFREVVLSEAAASFFANKCVEFVEGFRLKPDGETWVREDGVVFSGGEMISPWKDYNELDSAQRTHEQALIADMQNALNKLGVTVDG